MSSIPADRVASRPSTARTTIVLAAVIIVAVAINAAIAFVAVSAGAPADYGPLTFPAYATFTVIGVIGGWIGWVVVRRRARRPRAVLTVLVPVVVVLSLVPDVLLLTLRFIPGTTTSAALALMAMHVIVASVAVPGYIVASRTARPPSAP